LGFALADFEPPCPRVNTAIGKYLPRLHRRNGCGCQGLTNGPLEYFGWGIHSLPIQLVLQLMLQLIAG
jgi:hypothetical protein